MNWNGSQNADIFEGKHKRIVQIIKQMRRADADWIVQNLLRRVRSVTINVKAEVCKMLTMLLHEEEKWEVRQKVDSIHYTAEEC